MVKRILTDCLLWLVATVICALWRLLAAKVEIFNYIILFAAMMLVWVVLGLVTRKYSRSYKESWYWQDLLSLLLTGGGLMLLLWWLLPRINSSFSLHVALWTVGVVMVLDAVLMLFMHYYKYALNMTVPVMEIEQRDNAVVLREDLPRSPQSVETIHQAVLSLTTEEDYQMLLKKAALDNRRTKIVANRDRFSFMQIPDYQYDTLVDLTLLNDAKGINKRFCIVNKKLPDNGRYVSAIARSTTSVRRFSRVILWVSTT